MIAEIQAITYNEFLPALLGASAISDYHGYDASVDPTIANEFSTGAFRFGHSTVNDDVGFFDNQGRAVRDEVSLAEAFFNPSLLQESGLDATIKYIASSQSQEIDLQVVDSLRSFLFGQPGAGGLDLAALNIQRGRDHGLADYNSVRVAYGLAPVATFADITSDTDVQSKLQSLYGDVNNIDLWVGILAEDHLSGGSMGELGSTIIRDQFERLRDGDRLWYENVFTGNELRQLRNTSLADVIKRNTSITNLQDNVFFMRVDVSGTVVQSVAPNMPRSEVPRSEVPRFQMPRPEMPRPEMPRPEMPRSETPTRNPSRPPQPITNSLPQLGNRTPPRDVPIAGITVELLNMDGEVIDSTVTDSSGFYHFDSIDETGDYSVRIESDPQWTTLSDDTHDFLVSNGATRIRGLNFRLRLS